MNEKEKKEAEQKALLNVFLIAFKVYFPKMIDAFKHRLEKKTKP